MKKVNNIKLIFSITALLCIAACSKERLTGGPVTPGNQNPNNPGPNNPGPINPDSVFVIKVKTAITIGTIVYDSIPASLQIISWDSSGVAHQRSIELSAGTNMVSLAKNHKQFKLRLSKWGTTDEVTLDRTQIGEGSLISLGATKAARKLKLEEGFVFASGAYRPDSKTIYGYNGNGTIHQIHHYQKMPQHSDLKLYHSDQFVYSGSKVERIKRFDENGTNVGTTTFTYGAQNKIVNMHQHSYGNDTYASVLYGTGTSNIVIDYLYANGHAMEYKMKFANGNKTEDGAMSSTGGSEAGSYSYDFNINPFVHMNMPDIYLSNLSKNNMISQQKNYSGSIPSGVAYRFEYSYDAEGYPVELIKYYKSYVTGQDLYKTKTVYTYQS